LDFTLRAFMGMSSVRVCEPWLIEHGQCAKHEYLCCSRVCCRLILVLYSSCILSFIDLSTFLVQRIENASCTVLLSSTEALGMEVVGANIVQATTHQVAPEPQLNALDEGTLEAQRIINGITGNNRNDNRCEGSIKPCCHGTWYFLLVGFG
jgi:hypothetical protein